MTENSDQIKLTHEQLAHQLKRRVRILSPLLQKDPEHCYNPMACCKRTAIPRLKFTAIN